MFGREGAIALTMSGYRKSAVFGFALLLALVLQGTSAGAQDRALPYWATLRYDEVRMRVGPSEEYPIAWIYQRKGLPVKVVRLREGWRLVEDPEGTQGWIASSQLDPERDAMVQGKGLADIRASADTASALRWRAEPGVVARLLRCKDAWCEVDVAGRKGWTMRARLWGSEELPGDE